MIVTERLTTRALYSEEAKARFQGDWIEDNAELLHRQLCHAVLDRITYAEGVASLTPELVHHTRMVVITREDIEVRDVPAEPGSMLGYLNAVWKPSKDRPVELVGGPADGIRMNFAPGTSEFAAYALDDARERITTRTVTYRPYGISTETGNPVWKCDV